MLLDVDAQKANIVQLEITDSAVMRDVLTRLSTLETIHSKRKLIADSTLVRSTWTYFNIELVPQKLKITLYGSQIGVVIDTEIAISEDLSHVTFEVEIYNDNGTLRIRPFVNVNTSDEVFVKFTSDNKLGIKADHVPSDRVLIISEVFL